MANIKRKELVESVYRALVPSFHLKSSAIDACIVAFLDELKVALANKDSVELRGFGTFELKKCAARNNTRNPKTGQLFKTPQHYKAIFRAGSELEKKIKELE